ncbi:hypothetical protein O181_105908 [Austropuccinia psidii MF-1]|uniref:Uncharacterized protein n=1 Tax=Austropuccinia psidii MF-1 TaxID=1389203 RepID=A0A9Q3PLG0_9BASI|nr:hypothetical protein [Austropuccinia psidii MF-1]
MPVLLKNYPAYYQPKVTQRKPPAGRIGGPTKRKKSPPSDKTAGSGNVCGTGDTISVPDPAVIPAQQVPPSPPEVQVQESSPPLSEEGWSHQKVTDIKLPVNWCICNTLETDKKVIVHINPKTIQVDKSITFKGKEKPEVVFRGSVSWAGASNKTLTSTKEAQKLVYIVDSKLKIIKINFYLEKL